MTKRPISTRPRPDVNRGFVESAQRLATPALQGAAFGLPETRRVAETGADGATWIDALPRGEGRMRICFDARTIRAEMAGIGVYSSRLLREMIDVGGADRQWTLPHLPGAPLEDLGERENIDLVETRADYGDHPAGEWWLNVSLPRLLSRVRADVFHNPAYLVPWRPTRAKRIVSIHDLVAFRHPECFASRFAWYMRRIIHLSARCADGIVTSSQRAVSDMEELVGAPRDKIRVVHMAADPRLAPASEQEIADARRRHGLPERYLFFVGTLEPRKGILRMLRVTEKMAEAGEKTTLILAGKVGWRSDPLFETIAQSPVRDRVKRLNYVPGEDLAPLYTGAEALLFLSDYEGFGLPPLEAMACGCPVISSDRASLPEVVGDAGVLVDPDDIESVVATLRRWRSDPGQRRAVIEAGAARCRQFSWRKAAEETLAYYDEIAVEREA